MSLKPSYGACFLFGVPIPKILSDPCHRCQPRASSLRMSSSPPRPFAPRTLDEGIRDFLTQRAIQTILFYSLQMRDETSFNWLEEFLGHKGLYEMHHYNCLQVPWREYILTLLRAPDVTLTILKPYYGRGGATATNPYIRKKYFEYTVEIRPRSVGRRLLAVRAELAREFSEDLRLIGQENAQAWTRYRATLREDRPADDLALFPPLDLDPAHHASTPFRGGNYDLLKKFATHLAARRILQALEGGRGDDAGRRDAEWFRGFYDIRGKDLVDPRSGYRSADRFIHGLLQSTPAVRSVGSILDPMKLAQEVMNERCKIADTWIKALSTTSEDHLSIEREVLEESW